MKCQINDCILFKGSVAVLEARAVFLVVFQVYESCHQVLCIHAVAPI